MGGDEHNLARQQRQSSILRPFGRNPWTAQSYGFSLLLAHPLSVSLALTSLLAPAARPDAIALMVGLPVVLGIALGFRSVSAWSMD